MSNKKVFVSVEHKVIYNKLIGGRKSTAHEGEPAQITENTIGEVGEMLNELTRNIKVMEDNRSIQAHRMVHSHRKGLGKFIVFGKKVLRRCLKWYINPIVDQQTEFNNAVTPSIGRLTQIVGKQESDINSIKQKINSLDQIESLIKKVALLEEYVHELNEEMQTQKQEMQTQKQEMQIQKELLVGQAEQTKEIVEILDLPVDQSRNFFDKESYAQSGEDTILAYILFVLGIDYSDITYLDLGANHAKELSNTYYFYKKKAKGILVEANHKLVKELKYFRSNDVVLNNVIHTESGKDITFYVLNGDGLSTPNYEQAQEVCRLNPQLEIVETQVVTSITVNDIIEKYFGEAPTFISIDIEGKDLEILESLDFEKYRPLLVVAETIEYRPYLDVNIKGTDVIDYMKAYDYIEYAFTGINSIFIDKRYMDKRNEARR